jgi:hypothetical protein
VQPCDVGMDEGVEREGEVYYLSMLPVFAQGLSVLGTSI